MKKSACLFVLGCIVRNVLAVGPDSAEKLYTYRRVPVYTGDQLKTIAFPVGGLGAGNLTLGGRGDIRELEIFNRPAKNKPPDMTFFSIRVEKEGAPAVVKILERRLIPPYTGWMGFPRNQLAGISRFQEVEFRGAYPFAFLKFDDPDVPASISLEAFNPFIPLSPEKSGLPCALFFWTVGNPTTDTLRISLAFSMLNPIRTRDQEGNMGFGGNVNQYLDGNDFSGILMGTQRALNTDLEWGEIAFATSEANVDVQTRWYRGGWWDNAHRFWDDFSADGRLDPVIDAQPSPDRKSDVASILVHTTLPPGDTKTIPVFLSWYFPNRENYWNREEGVRNKRFRNHYALRYDGAREVLRYVFSRIDALTAETRLFHDILFRSTYPDYVIDALSSQMSTLKTQVIIWDDQDHCYGWEGLTDNSGCCMGTCTHVWNYEQTLAFLFPSLERSMREIAFQNDTFANGYQTFRTLFPPGPYWWEVHPATDGQMGNIIRVYREWKLSGNTSWLKMMWPKVRASLEFAWKGVGSGDDIPDWQKRGNPRPWDMNRDGVMEGRQHNTYDIDFYGPNTMVGSLYLAALKAASEMAGALGEHETAAEYASLFSTGSAKYDSLLWNGDYYEQIIEVAPGLEIPDHLRSPEPVCTDAQCACKQSPGGKQPALDRTGIVPKYQYGQGCLSDQLLGQYLAYVTGIGYVLPENHVKKTLGSIFRYNFQNRLDRFSNVQRVYALNDEAGLLLCSWPRGKRPALPFVYSDEVWTGIEYQVAASLIYSGQVEKGLTLVKAVRDRHRGFNRNPWDEFECGHHYARAMASWAVLLALSGYEYDGVLERMAFSPCLETGHFSTFWSCGTAWGEIAFREGRVQLKVAGGALSLKQLGFPVTKLKEAPSAVSINSNAYPFLTRVDKDKRWIEAEKPFSMEAGDVLEVLF
jgi:uncharacterized protein (DUF608 family)